jgi:hypothetical protein
MLKPPNWKSRQNVRRSVDDKVWDEVLCHTCAPIHATPHFVAFFVPRVVVYASSQDFVETALGQPYLDTKGATMPALYPIPGFSAHPDHIRPHTIFPHKPEAPKKRCVCPEGDYVYQESLAQPVCQAVSSFLKPAP